jgi:uncharacterized membrane protein YphA (DoxX/SURF4 family)
MSKAVTIARILLGLVFFVFGLNFFLHFIPQPPMTGRVGEVMGALIGTGFLFQMVKVTEVTCGALLLAGRYVPLALAMLAPIIINIVAFHGFLAPSGLPLAFVVLGLELFLAWSYRRAYAPMLKARVDVG